MKIFFTTTTAEFPRYRRHYFSIRDFLIKEGHVLTRDWLPNIVKGPKSVQDRKNGSPEIYRVTLQAINDADVVIVEDTVSSLSNGHVVTVALQQKKPVLILWLKEKRQFLRTNFIEGLSSDYLQTAVYSLDNYQQVVKRFLNRYKYGRPKHRFHLVINDEEKSYLDWAQFRQKVSRTQLIRQGIRRMMAEDKAYQKYRIP